MGAISGGLLALDGMAGLRGWQWLFLVQGLPAVLLGMILLRFLPDAPATVNRLSDPEKTWIQNALAEEAAVIGDPAGHNVFAAFRNPRVLLLGVIAFLMLGEPRVSRCRRRWFSLIAAQVSIPRTLAIWSAQVDLIGAVTMLLAGRYSDSKGDRLRTAPA